MNLYTGCTFQHKNAVINTCPVKKEKESKTYNSDKHLAVITIII